jgi:hypothetical protein
VRLWASGENGFDDGLHRAESLRSASARGHRNTSLKKNRTFGVHKAGGDLRSADVHTERH